MAELLLIPLYRDNEGLGTLWVMCHDTPRKFDREDVRILSSLTDFTAATLCTLRLQQQQQQAEDLYRSLIEGIPHIVFTFDRDGNTIFVNEQWTVYTAGPPSRALAGLGGPQCIQMTCRIPKVSGKGLNDGPGLRDGVPDEKKGRSLSLAIGAGIPVKDGDGNVLKWFGTCTDIDEQKRTQPASPNARKKDERPGRNRDRSRLEQVSPPSDVVLNSKVLQ